MPDNVISVRDFRKVYGSFVAVDAISFEVGRGEIFGLLGPNGAGKTSTLECLEGIRRGDGGSLAVLGVDPARQPRRLADLIGVQLQTSALPESMTPHEAIAFFCAYHKVAPRYDLIERLGLAEKRHAQYSQLSIGQQRRLALALAVAHRPPVVILDEPTAGLDVGSRTELHAMMAELRAGETSILLATHDMAEAEKMADRVAILLRGRVAATGTPRELTAAGAGFTKVSVRTENDLRRQNVAQVGFARVAAVSNRRVAFFGPRPRRRPSTSSSPPTGSWRSPRPPRPWLSSSASWPKPARSICGWTAPSIPRPRATSWPASPASGRPMRRPRRSR